MRSSRKYLFLPLPLPRVETTEIPRGGGGGVQKEAISEGVGVASRVLQVRSMSYLKVTAALLRKLSVIFLLTVF